MSCPRRPIRFGPSSTGRPRAPAPGYVFVGLTCRRRASCRRKNIQQGQNEWMEGTRAYSTASWENNHLELRLRQGDGASVTRNNTDMAEDVCHVGTDVSVALCLQA